MTGKAHYLVWTDAIMLLYALLFSVLKRSLADLDDVDIEILKTILEGVYIECQMTKVTLLLNS